MASTADAAQTGVPPSAGESEPLLGRPGDALQKPNSSMFTNLVYGTGWLAQAGVLVLLALVWSSVFLNPLLPLFSPHPLLQSLGVFTLTQAVLVLQPTWTPEEKLLGARAHASLNLLSFALFAAGVAMVETHKIRSNGAHFHSVHGYLGATTAMVLLVQYVFGFLMWGVPGVFGGIDNAEAVWKYHRMSGYLLFLLVLATVLSAVETDYNKTVLDLKMWAVAVAVALIIIGIYPRIHPRKFGFDALLSRWRGQEGL